MKTKNVTSKKFALHSQQNPKTKQRATVGAVLEGNELKFGIAVCSGTDQFVKKVGYLKACGRALMDPNKNAELGRDGVLQGPIFSTKITDPALSGKVFLEHAKSILENKGFPYSKTLKKQTA